MDEARGFLLTDTRKILELRHRSLLLSLPALHFGDHLFTATRRLVTAQLCSWPLSYPPLTPNLTVPSVSPATSTVTTLLGQPKTGEWQIDPLPKADLHSLI